jgi:hypothetical protein
MKCNPLRFPHSNGKTVDKTLTVTSGISTGITGVSTQEISVYIRFFFINM